jgi:protein-S-isoprenylcysteine O-methyltransferase Ste14
MGSRTKGMPELGGIAGIIREMRYHEFSRQAIGILLIPVFAYWAASTEQLFWAGAGVATLGILVRLWASGFVVKNKELSTTGPYAMVRHPLYTGNILMLIGFCIANGQLWPWAVGAFFLLFWYPPAISYEDNKLHGIFGDPWVEWSSKTPALIPRGLKFTSSESTGWSFMKSLKQNWEPVIVVYSFFWLWWMWQELLSSPSIKILVD